MIKNKILTINGKKFIRTYSDNGCMIERDGVLYAEAVDPADLVRTYTETDEPLPELPAEEALGIIMGGSNDIC